MAGESGFRFRGWTERPSPLGQQFPGDALVHPHHLEFPLAWATIAEPDIKDMKVGTHFS